MAFFGYLIRNGTPSFSGGQVQAPAGSLSGPGVAIGSSGLGFYQSGNSIVIANSAASNNPPIAFGQGIALSSGSQITWTASNSTANGQTVLQQLTANKIQLFDGSTTPGTLRLGIVEWGEVASTFAQVATITNGPRAANPVHWASVSFNNGASTGRVPIW